MAMSYHQINWNDLFVTVSWSRFEPKQGVPEFHVFLELTNNQLTAEEQFRMIDCSIDRLKQTEAFVKADLVWKRYFVSDAVNQKQYIQSSSGEAVSFIQQPPLNGTKLSLWAYFVEDISMAQSGDGTFVMKRPHYTHLYHVQIHEKTGNSYEQTQSVFNQYIQSLKNHHCTLEAHCLRTWIFVQSVDIQYEGMVKARRELFEKNGLQTHTHFIASTGIAGQYVYPSVLVLLDAYAIQGIQKEQITYLHGSTHLNPTHEYGVTFERGVSIQYGDRRHILISGTASIDNKGEIVHPLDIEKQTERTLENIRVLLTEAEAAMTDVAHLIIYLRDIADYERTKTYFQQNYPEIPKVILLAPVCRPGWLIEIECMAIKATDSIHQIF
jgi:enamine deaminase RidA (YjgF/YER057c/UK114 family)